MNFLLPSRIIVVRLARRWAVLLLIGLSLFAQCSVGRSAENDLKALKLELTSPFAATPGSLDSDASGEFLVTTTSSGILTLWTRSAESAWKPNVIHPPQRDEYASGGYYAAITPDGSTIALAVPPLSDGRGRYKPNTAAIYLIDKDSKQLMKTFSAGLPTFVRGLRFSPDGQTLGAVLSQGCGVRTWNSRQWGPDAHDQSPDFADDTGYAGPEAGASCCAGQDISACDALADASDLLFTGVVDGSAPWMLTLAKSGLRSYFRTDGRPRMAGAELLTSAQMGLKLPTRMALSPDKSMLAVGDFYRPQVAILARSGPGFHWSAFPHWTTNLSIDDYLNETGRLQVGKDKLFVEDLVWTQSAGKLQLYVFGYFPSGNFTGAPEGGLANRVLIFDAATPTVQFVQLKDDTDTSLRATPIAGASAPILFISTHGLSALDPDAEAASVVADRAALDLRGDETQWPFRLNRQRKLIYLTTAIGARWGSLAFDYENMALVGEVRTFSTPQELVQDIATHGEAAGFYDAEVNPDAWGFQLAIGTQTPVFFGVPLATPLNRDEIPYSGAKVPGQDLVVWGTDRSLNLVDAHAKVVCSRSIATPAHRVNITPEGGMAAVAHGDGVIRFYRIGGPGADCLTPVASIFLTHDRHNAWGLLAWLPNGKFMTSGGAALKDLACYPVSDRNNLGRCTRFQDTEQFFAPEEVKQTLARGVGTAPTQALADAVASAPANQPVPFHIEPSVYTPAAPQLPLKITITAPPPGPQYLTLSVAGADVSFSVGDDVYSRSKPYPLSSTSSVDLVLNLPVNVQQDGKNFSICAALDASRSGDAVHPSDPLTLSDPCKGFIWKGDSAGKPTTKLWALVIGVSEAPRDGAPQLDFAHDDAINVARFLQLDFEGRLPGKSRFKDMDVTLLVAAPVPDLGWRDLVADPRIVAIRNGLTASNFHFSAVRRDAFSNQVKGVLESFVDSISHQAGDANQDNEILVYFAGHGFTKPITVGGHTIFSLQLVTPDYDPQLLVSGLRLEADIVATVKKANVLSMIVIDACSAPIDGGDASRDQRYAFRLFRDPPIDHQSDLTLYLASSRGGLSYEVSGYSLDDFVPGFHFWAPLAPPKGGGLFTMGLLASQLCNEGATDDQFDFNSSKEFLKKHFFSPQNSRWNNEIEPSLAQLLAGAFIMPDPSVIPYGETPALRSGATAVPKCAY